MKKITVFHFQTTKIFYLLISLFVFSNNQLLFAQNAASLAAEAQQEVARLDFGAAIKKYEKALRAAPNNDGYKYELALANYRESKYDKTIYYLEGLVTQPNTEAKYFRLLGNAYDLKGNYPQAMATLKKGIQRHPNQGKLYVDLGVIEMIKGDYSQAINYWEEGIAAIPTSPDNYYWAAKYYAKSNEKIWSLIYGEIFINMERGTKRFDEIVSILYDNYATILKQKNSQNVLLKFDRRQENSFYVAHERLHNLLDQNGLLLQAKNANGIKMLESISLFRKGFLELWVQSFAQVFPTTLYGRHQELLQKGFFESYNYWLFSKYNPDEFMSWMSADIAKYNAFIDWFLSNPLNVDPQNYIVRMKYVKK